jgi:RimJ/RimL family protein N-acetyltransferase
MRAPCGAADGRGAVEGGRMDLTAVEIRTERLCLRSFSLADSAEVHAQVSWRLTQYMAFDPAPSLAAFLDTGRGWLPRMAGGLELILVVRDARSGGFLGMAGLHGLQGAQAEAGIWIRESAHGAGYGRESVAAALRWARLHAALTACFYPVAEANLPSRRIAESLGGTVVGKRSLTKSNGQTYPLLVYRLAD